MCVCVVPLLCLSSLLSFSLSLPLCLSLPLTLPSGCQHPLCCTSTPSSYSMLLHAMSALQQPSHCPCEPQHTQLGEASHRYLFSRFGSRMPATWHRICPPRGSTCPRNPPRLLGSLTSSLRLLCYSLLYLLCFFLLYLLCYLFEGRTEIAGKSDISIVTFQRSQ
jgi:hypothetical protein